MRIAHNIPAITTHRSFTTNNDRVSESNSKLSSGLRINKAADDAAGLAISEKMRAQVRGLDMATRNSQDAISLVQTAEGALQEVHSMLQRMNELAVQSNTGTNENIDRSAISSEFEELKKEIDQISEQTTFNNMKLLDGSMGSGSLSIKKLTTDITASGTSAVYGNTSLVAGNLLGGSGAANGFSINKTGNITAASAGSYTFSVGNVDETGKFSTGAINGANTHFEVTFTDEKTGDITKTVLKFDEVLKGDVNAANSNVSLDLSAVGLGKVDLTSGSGAPTKTTFETALNAASLRTTNQNVLTSGAQHSSIKELKYTGGDYAKIQMSNNAGTITFKNLQNDKEMKISFGTTMATAGKTIEIDLAEIGLGKLSVTADSNTAITSANFVTMGSTIGAGMSIEGAAKGDGTMTVQVGANKGDILDISIGSMNSKGLGLTNLSIGERGEGAGTAGAAIDGIKGAIKKVSEQRSNIGAMQNRLNYKINNLKVSSENLTAAESRIRDVDIAKEMTEFTKSGILSQAATSMLAQANSAPQQVLSLLQ